jgi:hypothetical protein
MSDKADNNHIGGETQMPSIKGKTGLIILVFFYPLRHVVLRDTAHRHISYLSEP